MRTLVKIISTLLLVRLVSCILLDINSTASICAAADRIIGGQLSYYEGIKYGGTVGTFTWPYYWWHAGDAFGGWVDYWAFCAKDNQTFTRILFDAMYSQRGEYNNYVPENQTTSEANDDQGVWGLALMQAVERNFPNPTDQSWLVLTQTVFNNMNNRWNTTACNGGLKWQFNTRLDGFYYKSTIANGCLFQLAARLYRYTKDIYYLQSAERVWDWMMGVEIIDTSGDLWRINDGGVESDNCTSLTTWRWSYNCGIILAGSAYLYNATNDTKWQEATKEITDSSGYFFNNSIMTETSCTVRESCNQDQRSFRSLLSRYLGLTAVLAPETYSQIVQGWLQPSALAAAQSCSGDTSDVCGFNWSFKGWDGIWGLGEQMSALECILSLTAVNHAPPILRDASVPIWRLCQE